ncbi:MAG: carboxypeptidase-like regulatory domain-containing protein [Planctomycetota bacterium]
MRRRSNAAGTLALLVASTAVLAGFAAAVLSGHGSPSPAHAIDRAEPTPFVASRPDAGPVVLETLATPASHLGSARESDATSEKSGFEASIRVLDAKTGLEVRTAWFQRSEFGAIGGRGALFDVQREGEPASLNIDGERATVLVSAPRYVAREVALDRAGVEVVRLERATSLVGTVRDGQSALVKGARVVLEYLGPTLDGASGDAEALPFDGPTLRRTDERGEYAFTGLAPGVYRATCSVGSATHTSRPTLVADDAWTRVDHWLAEATRLSVQVARPDGLPAARARLLVTRPGEGAPALTRYTDEEGRATLGPLDPGTYDVAVQSRDGETSPRSLTIHDDGQAFVDLHLQLARMEPARGGRSQTLQPRGQR